MAKAAARGVTADLLRTAVHNLITDGVHPDNKRYQELWELADQLSSDGLKAQLSYLVDALGLEGCLAEVDKISVLDTFIRRATSPDQLES